MRKIKRKARDEWRDWKNVDEWEYKWTQTQPKNGKKKKYVEKQKSYFILDYCIRSHFLKYRL